MSGEILKSYLQIFSLDALTLWQILMCIESITNTSSVSLKVQHNCMGTNSVRSNSNFFLQLHYERSINRGNAFRYSVFNLLNSRFSMYIDKYSLVRLWHIKTKSENQDSFPNLWKIIGRIYIFLQY